MDAAHKDTIFALKSIRNQADSVLKKIEGADPAEQKSLAWKCAVCEYTKHFTRPVLAEVAAPCPKGAGQGFDCI